MDSELKRSWIEELRSGRHEQGESTLCRGCCGELAECCLGVLSGILPSKIAGFTWDGRAWASKDEYRSTRLPDGLAATIGLDLEQQVQLMDMNDGTNNTPKCTFGEIADWIEENIT